MSPQTSPAQAAAALGVGVNGSGGGSVGSQIAFHWQQQTFLPSAETAAGSGSWVADRLAHALLENTLAAVLAAVLAGVPPPVGVRNILPTGEFALPLTPPPGAFGGVPCLH